MLGIWDSPRHIYIDASTAIGILEREGVARIRHIDVGVLWLQHKYLRQEIGFKNIDGSGNPADLMTKGLSAEHITRYVEEMLGAYKSGRAGKAVEVHRDEVHGGVVQ